MLLADEVNRAPAKTQSALLEAMQENQVTIEGTTLPLPRPFMVLATQNPVEQEGVYRLPEAQLDRFLLRVDMGYPGHRGRGRHAEVCTAIRCARPSSCSRPSRFWTFRTRGRTFTATKLCCSISWSWPRPAGSIPTWLWGQSAGVALSAALRRARALLDGRHYFTHEDVHAVAPGVLGHRLIIRPEAEVEGKRSLDVVRELIDSVPVLTGR